jgi:hypothetical protein
MYCGQGEMGEGERWEGQMGGSCQLSVVRGRRKVESEKVKKY